MSTKRKQFSIINGNEDNCILSNQFIFKKKFYSYCLIFFLICSKIVPNKRVRIKSAKSIDDALIFSNNINRFQENYLGI